MSALHEKNASQKARLLNAEHWICLERARFYTDAHRETHGQHPSLRAAQALQRVFAQMTVRIEPDELLVGNRSSQLIAPPIAPERGDFTFIFGHLMEELKAFGYRISADDERYLHAELIPYWTGKTVRDAKIAAFRAHGLVSQLCLAPGEIHRKIKGFGVQGLLRLVAEVGVSPEPPYPSLLRLAEEVVAGVGAFGRIPIAMVETTMLRRKAGDVFRSH